MTHDFLAGGWWNETRLNLTMQDASGGSSRFVALLDEAQRGKATYEEVEVGWIPIYLEQLHYMQKHQSTLQRLENEECLQAYGNSMFESTYRSVLVVSNLTQTDNVIEVWIHSATDPDNDELWICNGHNDPWSDTCNVKPIAANPSSWTIAGVHQCTEEDVALSRDCTFVSAKVEYCLAEHSPAPCTVRINTYLLMVVIGCNLLKIGCLTFTVFAHDFQPLATVGDAVASFLDLPEDRTKNEGPLSIMDVKRSTRAARHRKRRALPLLQFQPKPRRWARAVSVTRWCFCSILYGHPVRPGSAPRSPLTRT